MSAPLSVIFRFPHALEMIVALAIGFGFGFGLERAGFGRADNLAAIFYGRNFRVLRVMFGAIVTAMIGLYFLDLTGVLALSSIGILDTYLVPQIVGGLVLGAGFIIGGYCPGTSIVGAASGKTDAMLFIAGLIGGSAIFTFGYGTFAPLQNATHMGRTLIHEYLRVPSGVVVFATAAFAVCAFWLVGRIETIVNRKGEYS